MKNIKLIRTDSSHKDFKYLVDDLNTYLKIVDGDEHEFYNQFNGIENLNHIVIAYINGEPASCGAFKKFDSSSVEIKRMFTKLEARNLGLASLVLNELEKWALEKQFENTILETGKRQVEAVKFYQKNQYIPIPNFGPYQGIENSVCFKKNLDEKRQ